ncbi:HlyD family efflux transporter periplasmic adaptor subunit [Myroides sp. 1354]|uniref:efflux RND transporter periplasmic adaptor subunit n=1 Tax=unclassified Myroides TaxID=2642485 RepID=UPI002577D12E|nr:MULTISPECIES: HlyD family efflux transporter periplasmic adaptor subunit [unclassified Myroides]MDM1044078.1 HlyD family efflux transporter periplasmic adaptor subunit [Myroides sp. R163-1]MDM1055013.1 HlyD family efflux transporter periplasmic adaptor subunit [Myroides sp. 1354]MDM1068310.1 HlyD family efflux transporter periplasmic adaptor subunit [Myroides sp. 1372]
MDRVLPRKNKKKHKILLIVGGVILLGLASYYTFFQDISLNVSKKEIRMTEVKEGLFEEYISFQGKVEPLQSLLINIAEGGAVSEIFVENGAVIQKGDPLVLLHNPSSELTYMSQESSLIEQMNNLNVNLMNIRNQEIGLMKDLISIEYEYKNAELQYTLNKKLFDQEILSLNEWNQTVESFSYQKKRKALMEQSVEKEKQSNQVQVRQINQSLAVIQRSLEKLKENKQNFLLKAPISGRLSSFEPMLGKTYSAGESIGKIDVLEGYKLVANVDEFYLDRIVVGQKGQVDIKGKLVQVEVSKVLPEIINGRFEVQLHFVGGVEELKLQEGNSVGIKLFLSGKEQRLLLAKGSFFTDTKGEWVYVVKEGKAERRQIEVGRENPSYYEVISGLSAGEQVIISSYKDYLRVNYLQLKD